MILYVLALSTVLCRPRGSTTPGPTLPEPSSDRGGWLNVDSRASAEQGDGVCPAGTFPRAPFQGPLLDAPGAGDFSAAGRLEKGRGKAWQNLQGPASGAPAGEATGGSPRACLPTKKFDEHS